jgi:hypothetical protein
MMQYYNYTLSDIEGMMPWERDLYVSMLIEFIEKEKQALEEESNR